MRKETIIPVTIRYGFTHTTEIGQTKQRIERTALYAETLFDVITEIAMHLQGMPHVFSDAEKLDYERSFGKTELLSELGKNLTEAIHIFGGEIPEPNDVQTVATGKRETSINTDAACEFNETENFDFSDTTDTLDTDTLALALSKLLNNPNLPGKLYSRLSRAITECENEDIDQSEIVEFRDSPEYIAMVLRGLMGAKEVKQ